jgi:hypothetical protein
MIELWHVASLHDNPSDWWIITFSIGTVRCSCSTLYTTLMTCTMAHLHLHTCVQYMYTTVNVARWYKWCDMIAAIYTADIALSTGAHYAWSHQHTCLCLTHAYTDTVSIVIGSTAPYWYVIQCDKSIHHITSHLSHSLFIVTHMTLPHLLNNGTYNHVILYHILFLATSIWSYRTNPWRHQCITSWQSLTAAMSQYKWYKETVHHKCIALLLMSWSWPVSTCLTQSWSNNTKYHDFMKYQYRTWGLHLLQATVK